MTHKREEILDTAKALISGDRHQAYGSALSSFTTIGKLWEQVLGIPVDPHQVALCLAQVKIARLVSSPTHEDSWVDAAGYIALGADIAL